MGALYKLDFPNGKSYIGITTRSARERFNGHRQMATTGKTALYAAWRKHGEPKLVTLAILEDRELASTEIRAIAVYKTLAPDGYNTTPGGDASPMTLPEISAKLRGNKHSLGKKFPAELYPNKAAFFARRKGVPVSESHLLAMKEAQNRPEIKSAHAARMRKSNPMHDPDIAAKQGAKMRGRTLSDSHKESARRAAKEAWADPEFRANQIAKRVGKKHSAETIEKMKVAQQIRRAKERAK